VAIRNLKNGSLKIKDGGSNELTIPIEEGNVSFTVRDEAGVVTNRGALAGFSTPLEEAMEVSFGIKFEEWQGKSASGASPSPVDALKKWGNASSWASTTTCGPFTVDLEFTISKPCTAAGEEDEVLTLPDFHADELSFEEGEEYNMITVRGRCLAVKPTSVRS